jgi:hypothetical protein
LLYYYYVLLLLYLYPDAGGMVLQVCNPVVRVLVLVVLRCRSGGGVVEVMLVVVAW